MQRSLDTLDMRTVRLIGWLLAMIAVVLVFYLVIAHIRGRWLAGNEPPTGEQFTLEQLRTLLRQGKMSPDEFERVKTLTLARHQQSLQTPQSPRPPAAGPHP
jgi:hypothetical protein